MLMATNYNAPLTNGEKNKIEFLNKTTTKYKNIHLMTNISAQIKRCIQSILNSQLKTWISNWYYHSSCFNIKSPQLFLQQVIKSLYFCAKKGLKNNVRPKKEVVGFPVTLP